MTRMNFERLRLRSRLNDDLRRYGPAQRSAGGNCAPSYGPLPPNLKFKGGFGILKAAAENTGLDGTWSASGRTKVYRTEEGGVMNWSRGTGTIWFQGRQPFVRDLYEAIESELRVWESFSRRPLLRRPLPDVEKLMAWGQARLERRLQAVPPSERKTW